MFQYALDAWQNESAGEQSLQTLSKLGYSDTAQVQRWLELMRRAPAYARLNNSERDRVDAIIPDLLAAAAACQDPDSTLRGCLNLVERLQQWPGYLSVLVYPGMLQRLVGLVGASPWLAQFLYSHPELLDRLLGEQLADGGTVDLMANVLREVTEETGLTTQVISPPRTSAQSVGAVRNSQAEMPAARTTISSEDRVRRQKHRMPPSRTANGRICIVM